MHLHIHGLGTCALGFDAPFVTGLGRLAEIPIADYAAPTQRRRFGRVSKLVYVAAHRALADAAVTDPSSLAIVVGTAIGEAEVSLELLAQIHESAGRTLSPKHVPNSVHNSPAGYLGIGLGNHSPSMTVSQGFLSAEAALVAAEDLLTLGAVEQVLVIAADEADPQWALRLEATGADELAARLLNESFQEGAIALVVGREPGGQHLGAVSAAVVCGMPVMRALEESLVKFAPSRHDRVEVAVRAQSGQEHLERAVRDVLAPHYHALSPSSLRNASSQAGAFASLAQAIRDDRIASLVSCATEVDDVGLLFYAK